MKIPENVFSRTLLGYLPVMAMNYDFFHSIVAAGWIVFFLWITVFFFGFFRFCFPPKTLKISFFIWLFVWAQAAWTITKLSPVWIISVFLVVPESFWLEKIKTEKQTVFSKKIPGFILERFVSGIVFFVLVFIAQGAVWALRNFLGAATSASIIIQFLLLSAISFLYKKPFWEREV